MRWRGKLLFMMIVYAAGFFTAIYVLAPADAQAPAGQIGQAGFIQDGTPQFDAQRWAASARAGMTKAMSFAEEKALQVAEEIKTAVRQSAPD